jgi:hypothetical protein
MTSKYSWSGCLLGSVLVLTVAADVAHAQNKGIIRAANPNTPDSSTSPAASVSRAPLPMSNADVALKSAANRAATTVSADSSAPTTAESGVAAAATTSLPKIVDRHNFAGLFTPPTSIDNPSNLSGAIGPTRYIQTVNSNIRIVNRSTEAAIATGNLNQLAGNAKSVENINPQIMWDPTTNRFYYAMTSVFAANDNRLSFGFSKTANPATVTNADWCQYTYTPANPSRFPDYPKLGDNRDFLIIGVNSFLGTTFAGSDLVAISKPAAGSACPLVSTFKNDTALDLRDTTNKQVFSPVPSNQVDDNATGFVVARPRALPATKLWFFNVTRGGGGVPVFGPARGVTVTSYTIPPDAQQASVTQLIDTGDARPTQAVQAANPRRSNIQSFYVQHTVRNPTKNQSVVRWYEINPAPLVPAILSSGEIGTTNNRDYFYNAAISPDRRKDGATAQYGDSFVIQYNVSSARHDFQPRIVVGSSFRGGSLQFLSIQNGINAYRDATCLNDGDTCRWPNYSSAAPDPRPTTNGRGEVWGTNQFSGKSTSGRTDFRTQIFAVQP